MGMRVGIVFLRIDHGDGRYVDDLFDRRGTLQHVNRTAHPHEHGADHFAASDLGQQLGGNVGRSQVGEDEYVGAPFQRAEGILLLNDFWRQSVIGQRFLRRR